MAKIDKTIVAEKNLTIVKICGPLTTKAMTRAIEEFHADRPTRLVLLDMLESTSSITGDEVEQLVATAKKSPYKRKKGKTAIVASNETDYSMGKLYKIVARMEDLPHEYKSFRDLDEARQWLGVGED